MLKERPEINVVVTRDSVCAADDVDAPHEQSMRIHSFTDPEVLARETSSGYLPSVSGVGHSWICVLNGVEVAEIKTDGIRSLVPEATFAERNRIRFVYKSARY